MTPADLLVVSDRFPCFVKGMENDTLLFGLVTPSLVVEREKMSRARIINLIIEHVPDDREAGEAIEIICVATSGRHDADGWAIWFAVQGQTLH